jgi:hypothetical protein
VNVRIVHSQGADTFNVEAPDGHYHAFTVRPDSCWIVPKEVAAIVCNDGHSGFYQHDDDASTLSEIRLLCSVLADQTMRTAIMAAITAGTHTLLA